VTFLQPGLASLPLTIQQRSTSVDSDTGETTETWSDVGSVWARVESRGGFAKDEYNTEITATERKIAVIDYRSGFAWSIKDTRLQSRGVDAAAVITYNIQEVSDVGELHHKLELTLEEVTP
tara:strand:+ start:141 stop:503 length:363 start_codon:yes stop_codon:yes gene_type:complete